MCDSPGSRSLRAGIFDATLASVLSAFPILAAAVLLAHLGLPHLLRPATE